MQPKNSGSTGKEEESLKLFREKTDCIFLSLQPLLSVKRLLLTFYQGLGKRATFLGEALVPP